MTVLLKPNNKLLTVVVCFVVFVALVTVVFWYIDSRGGDALALADSAKRDDRLKAADKLAKKSSTAARRALAKLAKDRDKWVAIRAIRSLGSRRDGGTQEVLGEIVRDKKIRGRLRGEAAAELGVFQDSAPILVDALVTEKDPEVRAGAAKGLSRMRDPKTIPQLVRALEDRDHRVRLWAITAIHKMIARRFGYNARMSPESQRKEIERIKAYLRKCGAL